MQYNVLILFIAYMSHVTHPNIGSATYIQWIINNRVTIKAQASFNNEFFPILLCAVADN